MAGDIRKSGEYALIAEVAEQIYNRFDKRVGEIVDKFETHAKEVTTQLADGDKTMALINQSVQGVKEDVSQLSTEVKANSTVVNQMKVDAQNFRRKGDTSPLATAALEPKKEKEEKPSWLIETGKLALQNAMVALTVAVMIWLLRGGAAPVVTGAAPPTTATAPTTPP